ncbi:MAG: hypothetical protein KAJ20_01280 [Candidatus Aenigmarchaeota archaeon]|nr:hypothetical protein [Candidatus Aenigmarchaeota archaeon]
MKDIGDIYQDVKGCSTGDVKDFLVPGIDEAAILAGETVALTHYLYVMTKDIYSDSVMLDLMFNLMPISPQIATYLGLRAVKLHSYIFKKETDTEL